MALSLQDILGKIDRLTVQFSASHAPTGGATVKGKFSPGGEFMPSLTKLDDQRRKAKADVDAAIDVAGTKSKWGRSQVEKDAYYKDWDKLGGHIPVDHVDAIKSASERHELAVRQHDDALAAIGANKTLADFTKEQLSAPVSYSKMRTATRDYRAIRDAAEKSIHERMVLDEQSGQWKPMQFQSAAHARQWQAEHTESLMSDVAGSERVWFRVGLPPKDGQSFNAAENRKEKGVSVYVTPVPGSMAGGADRDIYYGNGRQIGYGGDDEPLVAPTGEWKKFTIAEWNRAKKTEKK